MNEKCVLTSSWCSTCVWRENGFYNPICAHCPRCDYSKGESAYMTRDMAEAVGLVEPKDA